jgi:D-erythro-7,8-dihydroneopterin triphosphate epimerase
MNRNPVIIRFKNLLMPTDIGINNDKISDTRNITIKKEIHCWTDQTISSHKTDDVLNYQTITKTIFKLVVKSRFSLLEKLSADLLAIAEKYSWGKYPEAEVDKHHALCFTDSVYLCLSCNKNISKKIHLRAL